MNLDTMIFLLELIVYIVIFAAGMCIFSFLNVVIYRVPAHRSFAKGFSACMSCGHRLYGKDMVPIFSWLTLKGRCRYCGAKVTGRYSIIEAVGGALAVFCYAYYGAGVRAVLSFAFFAVLMVIAMIDADTMEIPTGCVIALLVVAIVSACLLPDVTILSRIIGAVCISVPMLLLTIVIPGAFGGGDIRLVAVTGILLGWQMNLTGFFFAVLCGGCYGAYLLLTKKKGRKEHFAFGPFLCVGMGIAYVAGRFILSWYLGLLLY